MNILDFDIVNENGVFLKQYNAKRHLLNEEQKNKYDLNTLTTNEVVIIPGSFNPIHDGHYFIYEYMHNICPYVMLEISIANYDKPTLTYGQLQKRLEILDSYEISYFVTNNVYLIGKRNSIKQKGKSITGYEHKIIFAIGMDTYNRLIDYEKYPWSKLYKEEIKSLNLYVFGRNGAEPINNDIKWDTPPVFVDMNINISSTEIRNKEEKK